MYGAKWWLATLGRGLRGRLCLVGVLVCVVFGALYTQHTLLGFVQEITHTPLCGACFQVEGGMGGVIVGMFMHVAINFHHYHQKLAVI